MIDEFVTREVDADVMGSGSNFATQYVDVRYVQITVAAKITGTSGQCLKVTKHG